MPGSATPITLELKVEKLLIDFCFQPFCREHHMGKYTLVAQNRKGAASSNCDLIVRKKQFPPVFWQRLYNYEASSGTRSGH